MGIWGLGQIGEAQGEAESLQRKENVEKAYLAVQQQYAKTNQERNAIDVQREQRLAREANKPALLDMRASPDGSLIATYQTPDGKITHQKLPYGIDVAAVSRDIDSMLGLIKDPIRKGQAQANVKSYIDRNDWKNALATATYWLKQEKPEMVTERDTTSETDPFSGVTTTKSTTKKVPSTETAKAPKTEIQQPPKATFDSAAKPKITKAVTPKATPSNTAAPLSPAGREAFIQKMGWKDAAPSPAFYDENSKISVPRKYWPRIDQMAENLANGAIKIPSTNPKNYQLWAVISQRAREMGWNGGAPPTTNERDAATWARKALPHIPETRDLITQLDAMGALGPIAGRVNEFMTGKVGTDLTNGPNGALYVKLRDNMLLLNTALMRQHVGARGGQKLLEHFTDLWQPSRMDAATLNAALDVMENFMTNYSTLDQTRTTPQVTTPTPAATPPPAGQGNDPVVNQYLKGIGVQ